MTSVAVLGTGLLGTAIATRLLEQGLNVHVWNRDPSRIVSLVEKVQQRSTIWGKPRKTTES